LGPVKVKIDRVMIDEDDKVIIFRYFMKQKIQDNQNTPLRQVLLESGIEFRIMLIYRVNIFKKNSISTISIWTV
jgi:hypothetical protein